MPMIRREFRPRALHVRRIELPPDVHAHAVAFADNQYDIDVRRKRKNARGFRPKYRGHGRDIARLGHLGEAAVALYLGIEPKKTADHWTRHGDVAFYGVRTTDYPDGRLTVKPKDRDEDWLVLVIAENEGEEKKPAWRVFHVCGRMRVGAAREMARTSHAEWWGNYRAHGTAIFVPQVFLEAIPPLTDEQRAAIHHNPGARLEYRTPADPGAVIEAARAAERGVANDAITDWRAHLRSLGVAPEGSE